jgi:hypothetical protein
MTPTWEVSSRGEVQTPYQNSTSPYSVYKTTILEKIPIYVLQSPQTRSLIIEHKDKPARLHLGMARSKDLCSATYNIACTKEFKESINHKYVPQKNAISAMLIREPVAQSPFINTYLGSGFESRLYAIMDVHHIEDKDGVKGLSGKVCNYRIDIPDEKSEEIHEDIKLGILYDSIAGGRNLKAAVEDLKKKFKNLERVVFVSVYATQQGCERIAEYCIENNIEPIFFCMHELLNASPVNEYDCYYPTWNICKEDEEILKKYYKEKFREMPMGGDWTANTLGTEQAKSVFQQQIKERNIAL